MRPCTPPLLEDRWNARARLWNPHLHQMASHSPGSLAHVDPAFITVRPSPAPRTLAAGTSTAAHREICRCIQQNPSHGLDALSPDDYHTRKTLYPGARNPGQYSPPASSTLPFTRHQGDHAALLYIRFLACVGSPCIQHLDAPGRPHTWLSLKVIQYPLAVSMKPFIMSAG